MAVVRIRLLLAILIAFTSLVGAPARLDSQNIPSSPEVNFFFPARDEMVDGANLRIRLAMRPRSLSALNPSTFFAELVRDNGSRLNVTTRFKVNGPHTIGPYSDWYLADAVIAEGLDVPHARYTLSLLVQDKGGTSATINHTFRYIIDRPVSDLIRQRVIAVTPPSPNPQDPLPSVAPYTGFAEARAALENAAPKYVNPSTGLAWTRPTLLQQAVGRSDWLTMTAPYADRVNELKLAAAQLEWLSLPLTFTEFVKLDRTATTMTSFPDNGGPPGPGRGSYVATNVASRLPGELIAAKAAAGSASTNTAASVTSLTATQDDIRVYVCKPDLISSCPPSAPVGVWSLLTTYAIQRGVFRFVPAVTTVQHQPGEVRAVFSTRTGGWSDYAIIDPVNPGPDYTVGIGLSRQQQTPSTAAWSIAPATSITVSGSVPPTTTMRSVTLPLATLFPPHLFGDKMGTDPIYLTFQQTSVFPDAGLLAELYARIATTLGADFPLYDAGGEFSLGFPTTQPVLMYRIKEFRPVVDVAGLEVTQSVQNLLNLVPLIAGKPTVARAIVRSGPQSVFGLDVKLVGKRPGGQVLGTISPYGFDSRPVTLPTYERSQLASNALFKLPDSWLTGTLQLEVQAGAWSTWCEASSCTQTVNFVESSKPEARLVPVHWHDQFGIVHPSDLMIPSVAPGLRHLLPVSQFSTSVTSGAIRIRTATGMPPATSEEFAELNALLFQVRRTECAFADKVPFPNICPAHHLGILLDSPQSGVIGQAIIQANVAAAYIVDWKSPPGYAIADPPQKNLAHEYVHLLGRDHVVCAGTEKLVFTPANDYPHPIGLLGSSNNGPWAYFGTDLSAFGIVTSLFLPGFEESATKIYPANGTGDLMSYCPRTWMSDYSYKAALDALRALRPFGAQAVSPAFTGPALFVAGTVAADRSSAKLLPALSMPVSSDTLLPVPGQLALRLLNGAGTLLARYPFAPTEQSSSGPAIFGLVVPANAQTARLQIEYQGKIIGERTASGPAPAISIDSPSAGTTAGGPTLPVRWTATPSDGSLRYAVQLSSDGGASWQIAGFNLDTTSLDLTLNRIAGSNNARLRVLATDGVRSASAEVGPFTIPAQPPDVGIDGPASGQLFVADEIISLLGSATDPQTGALSGAALSWSSDLAGPLGNGALLERKADTLAEGVHLLTLTATNPAGLSASESVTIEVRLTAPILSPDLVAEPATIDFTHYLGFSAPLPRSLLAVADGGALTPAFDVSAPWLKVEPAYEGATAAFIVSVDPSALPAGNFSGTITASAPGLPDRVVPVSLAVAAPFGGLFVPGAAR